LKKARRRNEQSKSANAHNDYLPVVTVCIFLAVTVWLAFSGAIHNGFVDFDDDEYVYENAIIRNGLTLGNVVWAFTHAHAGNWHPLTTISHMLDCQLYGLQPLGHHLTNLLLHASTTVLLFVALRQLIGPGRTGSFWPCAFVAALFAVHPLRVESVVWISERKDVLSGVFFMLTLLAYAHYARGERRSYYVTVLLFFALGLMCKPILVTLPFVFLLLDYWPLGRIQRPEIRDQMSPKRSQWSVVRDLIVEKIPLFVLSAASCVITSLAQKEAIIEMRYVPVLERLANAVVSYVVYIGQLFYPAHLAVLYLYPEHSFGTAEVILSLLLLVILSVSFFIYRKRFPFLFVGWLWFLGMLVPMIGLVQVGLQSHADRYTYLPQIGLYILVTWTALTFVTKWRYAKIPLAAAALIILTLLITQSRIQASYWQTSVTLWKHTSEATSNNYMAYSNLGIALLAEGRANEAVAQAEKAIEIKPNSATMHRNLADALLKNGQVDDAIAHYQKALEIYPRYAEANQNLADALLQKGEVSEAIVHYQKALTIKPNHPAAENNLGNALARLGKYNEAATAFQSALRSKPDYPDAHNNLGSVLMIEGQTEEAAREFAEALRIDGTYFKAHYNLGLALAKLGRRDEAVAHLTEALRLKPDYIDAERALRTLERGE
jgi:tetratricopeptide (TPR) repeat protein